MNTPLSELMRRLEPELVLVELAAWAAYHGDPLPAGDRDRILLAARRIDAIRRAIRDRLNP